MSPRWVQMPNTRTRSNRARSPGPDVYVADRLAQTRLWANCIMPSQQASCRQTGSSPNSARSLPARSTGRINANQITIADLTGTGIQDTAIATLAFARAGSAGVGTNFES